MLKICKFGGSSLSNYQNFLRVAGIVKADNSRKIVVVSAIGKDHPFDKKITDLLILLTKDLTNKCIYNRIMDRFSEINKKLGVGLNLDNFIDLSQPKEYIISRGEYFSAMVLAKLLNFTFVDSFNLIYFKSKDKIDYLKTKFSAKKIDINRGIVVTGYYGNYKNNYHLFSRGGSDITGSILSRIFNCDVYENFSDKNGIMMVSPNIINNPKYIDKLSYSDFKRLKYLNPKIFNMSAYKPINKQKTTLIIKNTFNLLGGYTTITNKLKINSSTVFSMAINQNTIIITGRNLTKKGGDLQKITTAFKDIKVIKKSSKVIKIQCQNPKSTLIKIYRHLFN